MAPDLCFAGGGGACTTVIVYGYINSDMQVCVTMHAMASPPYASSFLMSVAAKSDLTPSLSSNHNRPLLLTFFVHIASTVDNMTATLDKFIKSH